MSKIQDIIWGMTDENKAASVISEHLASTSHAYTYAQTDYSNLRRKYAKALRSYVRRKVGRIVIKHSQSWCVEVAVHPLHNHTTHDSQPLVTVKWDGKHGKIELVCYAITPERVEQFLERFEAVVKATELHQQRITI